MYILDQYRTNDLAMQNLSDDDFMNLQIFNLDKLFSDEAIAIKDNKLNFIAVSNQFIKYFDKSGLPTEMITYDNFAPDKLGAIETQLQEREVIDNLAPQLSMFYLNKNNKKSYFYFRKRPLINPFTKNIVGISMVAKKISLLNLKKQFMQSMGGALVSQNSVHALSLSEQQKK